jgi:D-serine deaminase-like pyridoxal phosphate-dependent protein
MDRLVQRNVLALSGRAVEAAGDCSTLLLDKTGTITLGNRLAEEFLPVGGHGVAKLAEAEAMAAAGVGAILVTSPIAGALSARRAAHLAATLPDFRIVVDHVDGVAELAAAATSSIQVLIDVDPDQELIDA